MSELQIRLEVKHHPHEHFQLALVRRRSDAPTVLNDCVLNGLDHLQFAPDVITEDRLANVVLDQLIQFHIHLELRIVRWLVHALNDDAKHFLSIAVGDFLRLLIMFRVQFADHVVQNKTALFLKTPFGLRAH